MPDLSYKVTDEEFQAISERLAAIEAEHRADAEKWEALMRDLERIIERDPRRFRRALGLENDADRAQREAEETARALWRGGVLKRMRETR